MDFSSILPYDVTDKLLKEGLKGVKNRIEKQKENKAIGIIIWDDIANAMKDLDPAMDGGMLNGSMLACWANHSKGLESLRYRDGVCQYLLASSERVAWFQEAVKDYYSWALTNNNKHNNESDVKKLLLLRRRLNNPEEFLLENGVVVHNCQHMFHTNCLINEIKKHASAQKLMNIEELRRKDPKVYDEVISKECPLCGEVMINSIDTPFTNVEEKEFWNAHN